MKGGKRRPSVDPPPPAGDAGENHSGDDLLSSIPLNSPSINGFPEEDLSQHQQHQQRRKKRTTAVENEKIAEEGPPATEEELDGDEGDEDDDRDEEGEEGNGHSEDEGEVGEEEEERPKLADGYYEIEAVRRKRVRKGRAQYLIKWRGWPETANTWEPLENMLQCSDVIDAFEERMRSGKRSTRKRKRNSTSTQSQTKKKKQHQQHSPAADSYSVPAVKILVEDNSLPFPPVDDRNICNGEPNVTAVNDTENATAENERGVELGATRVEETEVPNELALKISQLKGAKVTNGDCVDKIPLLSEDSHFSEQDGLANGSQNSDCSGANQSSRTGAKRRKSSSVKRFKLDIPSDRTNDSQNVAAVKGFSGVVADHGMQNADTGTNDLQLKNKTENSKAICDINEIIRPVSFNTAMVNSVKDVSVTFTAKRTDGKEVTVDNKFLKANHPLLLINYYEQHLKYTPQ